MRRSAVILALAATLASCGGSAPAASSGSASATAPASAGAASNSPATPAASTSNGGGTGGQVILTLGSAQKTYEIASCTEASGVLNVMAGDQKADGVQFIFPADSGASPSLQGHIDGKEWVGTAKGTFARSGTSGSFASPTLGITGSVQGTFSCS